MKRIATTAVVLTTAILAGGCGAEAEATSTDISPTEPVTQTTTEAEEMETESIESTESEAESIIEDISISESEAKDLLKKYESEIEEADIEGYYDEIVYAFTTNFNEGKTEEESFDLAIQHAKELKAFDEEVAQAEKAKHDAETREIEANKLAEEQAKESPTPENKEVVNGGTDASVPVTKEVAEQQPQTPPPAPVETQPQETQPQAPTPQKTPEEIQAECDRLNAETSAITDPNSPLYGVTYVPYTGPQRQFDR